MTLKDRLRAFFHVTIFFWHGGWWYSINGTDVGYKCNCDKEFGHASWGEFFRERK